MTSTINYTNAPDDIEEALSSAIGIEGISPHPDQLILKTEVEKSLTYLAITNDT